MVKALPSRDNFYVRKIQSTSGWINENLMYRYTSHVERKWVKRSIEYQGKVHISKRKENYQLKNSREILQ